MWRCRCHCTFYFVIRAENKLSSVTVRSDGRSFPAAALNTMASPSLQIKAWGGWLLGAVRAGILWWSWVDRKLQNESRRLCPSVALSHKCELSGRAALSYAWLAPPRQALIAALSHLVLRNGDKRKTTCSCCTFSSEKEHCKEIAVNANVQSCHERAMWLTAPALSSAEETRWIC